MKPDRDDHTPEVPAGEDPPIVAALVAPLRALRAALGTGDPTPNPALMSVLQNATADAADTDGEHAHGLYTLESSLQTSADAIPTMRTTRSEISAIVDQAPQYLAVLRDAYISNAEAAQRVDAVIARFRRDSREVVDTATTESDADRVIALASTAFRDALSEVTGAQEQMDQYQSKLHGLQPVPLSTPPGFTPTPGVLVVPTRNGVDEFGYGQGGSTPNGQGPSDFGVNGSPQLPVQVPGQPVDPAIQRAAIEAQIQGQLIAAGVQLATAVIDAGVEIGVKAIDRLADVGGKALEVVAAGASEAIKEGLRPGGGTPVQPGSMPPAAPAAPNGQFDFGGPPDKPVVPPPAALNAGPGTSTPEPKPGPPPDDNGEAAEPPSSPAPPTPPPTPPLATAPVVPPASPPPPGSPKRGQLGVTETAATEAPAGAPVVEPPS
ncbi:hypothetical protein [Nocardia sp. XZ_19_369]|uniref:hypothetical protein n=1 Tax=Nocardia sp. XZ_19_369 TaxID=2769487 RepID=UPI00188F2FC6|nr:hypothetical protein [Nocardia sp. XZ_19_369]